MSRRGFSIHSGSMDEPDETDGDDLDSHEEEILLLRNVAVRLECLKLAVTARDKGDSRDILTIAKEFSGYVLGDVSE